MVDVSFLVRRPSELFRIGIEHMRKGEFKEKE
jgi:hypothetical protein